MAQPRPTVAQTARPLPPLAHLGRDLLRVAPLQRWFTIALPFLCVLAFFLLACQGWWWFAPLAVAAYSFFSYGSTSHDLVHGTLGLPRWLNRLLLSAIELLGLRSGHAYRAAHLHHHARFPGAEDVEGTAAHQSWWRAILAGPLHQPRVWWWALRHARQDRAWILFEGAASLALFLGAVLVWPLTEVPLVYVVLVVAGSWVFPLVTAYLPHDPKGQHALTQTRRIRGKVAAVLFLQHLYHLEHHLYPRVPHHHWPTLASRLDPYLDQARVPALRFGLGRWCPGNTGDGPPPPDDHATGSPP